MRVNYFDDLAKVASLRPEEREALAAVVARYAFRANDYYLNLIDWQDPRDPIRRIIIPAAAELAEWGALDPSREKTITRAKGVQHKYPYTVLLLCNEYCGGFCRFCFRKRLFMKDNEETTLDVSEGLKYIAGQPQVTNVLLTGGDPLLMSTIRLRRILEALRAIPHVQIIRLGSKLPAFNPWRILDDQELQQVLRALSTPQKRIYLMAHFDHPRELTPAALESLDCFLRCGVIVCNQNPLLAGVNDDPEVLAELFRRLSFAGVPPYYLFQCRPTVGNKPYAVPIVRGHAIFEAAKKLVSGLAKRARFIMSHASGKIEIVGVDRERIFMRYHRAKDPADEGRFLICRRNDEAYWLEDLEPVEGTAAPLVPVEAAEEATSGPE